MKFSDQNYCRNSEEIMAFPRRDGYRPRVLMLSDNTIANLATVLQFRDLGREQTTVEDQSAKDA